MRACTNTVFSKYRSISQLLQQVKTGTISWHSMHSNWLSSWYLFWVASSGYIIKPSYDHPTIKHSSGLAFKTWWLHRPRRRIWELQTKWEEAPCGCCWIPNYTWQNRCMSRWLLLPGDSALGSCKLQRAVKFLGVRCKIPKVWVQFR